MKKPFHFIALVASTSLFATANAQPTPDNRIVEPGVRIGRVFLGDTKAAVARRLGKPTKVFKLPGGFDSQLWRSNKEFAPGLRDTLEIVYRRGVVVQIEVTNPIFKTKNGLSISSLLANWRRKYGTATAQTRYYTDRSDQTYYDWRRAGIAIESVLDNPGGDTGEFVFKTLIVHRKGFAVVPDPGGEL